MGAVVEVAVAVVVEAGRDVERLVAGAVKVTTELDVSRKLEREVPEGLPGGLIAASGELARIRTGGLRGKEGVVVEVVDLGDVDGTGEELEALEGVVLDADVFEIDVALAAVLDLKNVEVGRKRTGAGGRAGKLVDLGKRSGS